MNKKYYLKKAKEIEERKANLDKFYEQVIHMEHPANKTAGFQVYNKEFNNIMFDLMTLHNEMAANKSIF